ncbi:dynactin subunit 6 [Thecamonas trahens ATCC 50062]|uniref:Dynactin subunit 6 n=1 Tax=Thecamonas trahens ATCC 50062 TaxID=461836 RepID=A0A0L0DGK2_THETB|nr:dynactin subunit 6 [Thecamonas trahens ATCC 50062]KNC51462.1 dynactin subunit 6 [Thecamonas trahens ATCC 50062]|eukprot:XP_013756124.1 dynactin subunit 6 [Thecamonas trahens ATCC 50062]
MACGFSALPTELVLLVFSFLAPSELATAARVCRAWRAAASDNAVWRPHALQRAWHPRTRLSSCDSPLGTPRAVLARVPSVRLRHRALHRVLWPADEGRDEGGGGRSDQQSDENEPVAAASSSWKQLYEQRARLRAQWQGDGEAWASVKPGHTSRITDVAVWGELVCSASRESIRAVRLETGDSEPTRLCDNVRALALMLGSRAADGPPLQLLAGLDSGVHCLAPDSGVHTAHIETPTGVVALAAGETTAVVATRGEAVLVYDVDAGRRVWASPSLGAEMPGVACDGRHQAFVPVARAVHVFDTRAAAAAGPAWTALGANGLITGIVADASGAELRHGPVPRVMTSDLAGCVCVWDMRRGEIPLTRLTCGSGAPLLGLHANDAAVAAVTFDKRIEVWSLDADFAHLARLAVKRSADEVVVAADAVVEGAVTLGAGCIVHPKAVLRATAGSALVLGRGCVVEELAVVESTAADGTMVLGAGNVVCVGAVVRDSSLGDNNLLRARCVLDSATLGDSCIIGASCLLPTGYVAPDRASIVGNPPVVATVHPAVAAVSATRHTALRDLLGSALPKFHHLRDDVATSTGS